MTRLRDMWATASEVSDLRDQAANDAATIRDLRASIAGRNEAVDAARAVAIRLAHRVEILEHHLHPTNHKGPTP